MPRAFLLPASALVAAFALRAFALGGEVGPDSAVYAQYAWNLFHGEFTLDTGSWYAHRLLVFAPAGALYAAFGVGTISTVAWPLFVSLAQVLAAWFLGRRLFGDWAGWISAMMLAALPLDAIESTRLMPDVILGGLMGIAGAIWMGGSHKRYASATAGLLLGLATVVRPYALVLLPLFVVDRPRRRELLALAIGLAVVVAPLLAIYAIDTGNPFFRTRVVSEAYASGAMAEGNAFGFYPRLLAAWWSLTGVHPALLLACSLVALVDPGRDRARLLVWIGALLAFLQFGSMSLTEWVPILKRVRFLTILSLPGAVLVGSVLAGLAGATDERRRWIPCLPIARRAARIAIPIGLAAMVALCAWRIDLDRSTRVPRNAAFAAVGAMVRDEPAVFADHWRTAIRLACYAKFEAGSRYYRDAGDRERMDRDALPEGSRIGYLKWFDSAEDVPPGLVIVDDEALRDLRKMSATGRTYASGDIPGWALDPPANWTLEFEGAGLRAWRVH